MDDQVIPASDTPETHHSRVGGKSRDKKPIFIIGGIIAVIGVALFSYILGSKNSNTNTSNEPSPTPQITTPATTTPTPVDEEPSGTPTTSITPTKKPTITPTPSPTPTPIIKTKVISSTASLDGFRSSNNGGNDAVEVRAGRNENLVTRGFVSFSLTDIPSGSTITEATLRLYQGQIIGNPYGVGGSIKLDHLNYGDSLDSSDYGMAALVSSFVTLTSNATVEWKDALVTTQLKDDVANARSRSQYRIHFTTENTGGNVTGDFAYFESADNNMGTGNTPQLVVKYY